VGCKSPRGRTGTNVVERFVQQLQATTRPAQPLMMSVGPPQMASPSNGQMNGRSQMGQMARPIGQVGGPAQLGQVGGPMGQMSGLPMNQMGQMSRHPQMGHISGPPSSFGGPSMGQMGASIGGAPLTGQGGQGGLPPQLGRNTHGFRPEVLGVPVDIVRQALSRHYSEPSDLLRVLGCDPPLPGTASSRRYLFFFHLLLDFIFN
jgi:hypothetical protein